jgi:DNA-binding CsgD family transcriptional regulator
VQELLSEVPELVCRLGFDRALLSRVEDDAWHAELMFILGDPVWAAEIVEAGRKRPHPLAEAHNEAKMVADRVPILVTGVRFSDDGRWGNQLMVEASRTRSYVAAPIIAGDHVIGMLHADCYGQRRDVDEVDRDLLGAFAQVFSLVLERAAGVRHRPDVRLQHADGQPFSELVIRTGRPPADPLIASLTPREFEVLRLLAAGCTNTAIARELGIADDTAKQHVKHILRKLQAGNRSAAVARYFRAAADER